MSPISKAATVSRPLFLPEPRKLLFSFSNFLAAALTLVISFEASLPRPWYALLTVYIAAQPMAGAFRPKLFHRLCGILLGASVSVALVPNFQHAPELLVLMLASWTGFCIYLAVLDRTPRAFLFQMAAFSSVISSFPFLDDPGHIFIIDMARVEEMTLGIVCVSVVHMILQPWSVTPVIRDRAEAFLADAGRWMSDVLSQSHSRKVHEHRRKLAADIAELGTMAIHLPSDQPSAIVGRKTVRCLQRQMANMIPLTSAVADRLGMLDAGTLKDPVLVQLMRDTRAWLDRTSIDEQHCASGYALVERSRKMAANRTFYPSWSDLLVASVGIRVAEFLDSYVECCRLVSTMGGKELRAPARGNRVQHSTFPFARDHGVAALAGLATAAAIFLHCFVWISLEWPAGAATTAFATLISCSFSALDDPFPMLRRYLIATLVTFPLGAFYLFSVQPRVDGYAMFVITLAPALIFLGYLQAMPAYTARALPMLSCLIVAIMVVDRYDADFASFVNVGLAQLSGVVTSITIAKLFRSVNVQWTSRRMIRSNWSDIGKLAKLGSPSHALHWTEMAIDRLGQIAARMATMHDSDPLHETDGLGELRLGRNIIALRRSLKTAPLAVQAILHDMLDQTSTLFATQAAKGSSLLPPAALLNSLDMALVGLCTSEGVQATHPTLMALVSMRCNLFPNARPPGGIRVA